MANEEIKTRYTVEGDEALRELERIQKEQEETARNTDRMGKEADEASGKQRRFGEAASEAGRRSGESSKKVGLLTRAYKGLQSSLGGLIAGAASFGILSQAIRANTEDLERNARAANDLKRAQLDLQFLNQGYNPQELAAVRAASELVGGDEAQVDLAGAFANLKSKTAGLGDQQRIDLFEQLVETSLTTSTSPSQLVGLFARGSQFVDDPERLQNIIRKTQELSPAASPTVLEGSLPAALAVGQTVGLTAEQTSGLLVSALTANEEQGPTSLRNILTILAGGVTPAGAEILQGAGAAPGSGVINQLNALRDADLNTEQITTLFGRENFATFAALTQQDQYNRNIGSIFEATQGDSDLTQEAINNIFRADRQQALRLQTDQAAARVQDIRASRTDGQRAKLVRALLEEQQLRQDSLPPFLQAAERGLYDTLVGVGFDPVDAAKIATPTDTSDGRLFGLFAPPAPSLQSQVEGGPNLDVSGIGRAYEDATPGTVVNNFNVVGQQFNNAADPAFVDSGRTAQ